SRPPPARTAVAAVLMLGVRLDSSALSPQTSTPPKVLSSQPHRPPRSTLFPYPALFRSGVVAPPGSTPAIQGTRAPPPGLPRRGRRGRSPPLGRPARLVSSPPANEHAAKGLTDATQ